MLEGPRLTVLHLLHRILRLLHDHFLLLVDFAKGLLQADDGLLLKEALVVGLPRCATIEDFDVGPATSIAPIVLPVLETIDERNRILRFINHFLSPSDESSRDSSTPSIPQKVRARNVRTAILTWNKFLFILARLLRSVKAIVKELLRIRLKRVALDLKLR